MTYLAGLLSPAERKNSWQLAEISGDPNPYGFQHLLGRADWDPDALRDRLRTDVTDYLAAVDAVGVIDETGFLKKGTYSAGVARQYSGTAGWVENCQMGGFLADASGQGHTLLDRELYLPAAWTADRDRCRRAGIPDDRAFATKPALAQQLLARNPPKLRRNSAPVFGRWSWPSNAPRTRSCAGRGGGVGIRRGPAIITIADGRAVHHRHAVSRRHARRQRKPQPATWRMACGSDWSRCSAPLIEGGAAGRMIGGSCWRQLCM